VPAGGGSALLVSEQQRHLPLGIAEEPPQIAYRRHLVIQVRGRCTGGPASIEEDDVVPMRSSSVSTTKPSL
jgi:hypothetical protein